jgi:hypothetical protein
MILDFTKITSLKKMGQSKISFTNITHITTFFGLPVFAGAILRLKFISISGLNRSLPIAMLLLLSCFIPILDIYNKIKNCHSSAGNMINYGN